MARNQVLRTMMPDFSIELPFFAYIRQEQAGDSETPCDGAARWQGRGVGEASGPLLRYVPSVAPAVGRGGAAGLGAEEAREVAFRAEAEGPRDVRNCHVARPEQVLGAHEPYGKLVAEWRAACLPAE